ncbi:MAG TPA: HemK2/MTQ2 family protein methyltransferase [Thermoleophilaceae bacterium]|nr:HemK2/MTQ2 family protein methyltransferase [Thermoleophilaceae bacterium]
MRILAPPGVFRPHSDTWLLAEHLRGDPLTLDGHVLDLCCGSGALAVSALRAGAATATAVDLSRRAVMAARVNGRLNGVRVRARRGDMLAAVPGERYDLIVSNPPYLPAPDGPSPERRARAWDAGPDGRLLLDRICAEAHAHLRPGGALLLVHSSVCDEGETLRRLRWQGMEAEVADRRRGPLGPLLRARAAGLEASGLLERGVREEDLVVIRAVSPAPGRAGSRLARSPVSSTP